MFWLWIYPFFACNPFDFFWHLISIRESWGKELTKKKADVYLPFGQLLLLLSALEAQIILLFFCYFFILDHLLIDDISRIVGDESIFDIQVSFFKFATRIEIEIMVPDKYFPFEFSRQKHRYNFDIFGMKIDTLIFCFWILPSFLGYFWIFALKYEYNFDIFKLEFNIFHDFQH